jgi:ABC-type Mn2+/Zn2+ transport system permease subunit
MIFLASIRGRLLAGWALGFLGSAAGLSAAAIWDLPPGESVVTAFGSLFLACALAYAARRRLARPAEQG